MKLCRLRNIYSDLCVCTLLNISGLAVLSRLIKHLRCFPKWLLLLGLIYDWAA